MAQNPKIHNSSTRNGFRRKIFRLLFDWKCVSGSKLAAKFDFDIGIKIWSHPSCTFWQKLDLVDFCKGNMQESLCKKLKFLRSTQNVKWSIFRPQPGLSESKSYTEVHFSCFYKACGFSILKSTKRT